jgi:hypothetical protein
MSEPVGIPMLFECWECERTHALIEGEYVVEKHDPGARLREIKFYCIPCAEKVFGEETVSRVLARA